MIFGARYLGVTGGSGDGACRQLVSRRRYGATERAAVEPRSAIARLRHRRAAERADEGGKALMGDGGCARQCRGGGGV